MILFLNWKILLILHEPTWVSELTATQNNQDLRPKPDTCAILGSGTFILTPPCNSSLSHWFLTQLRGTLQSLNCVFTGAPWRFSTSCKFSSARNSGQIFTRRVFVLDNKKEQQCFFMLFQGKQMETICVSMCFAQPVYYLITLIRTLTISPSLIIRV